MWRAQKIYINTFVNNRESILQLPNAPSIDPSHHRLILADGAVNPNLGGCHEGKSAKHKGVERDPEGPHVDGGPFIPVCWREKNGQAIVERRLPHRPEHTSGAMNAGEPSVCAISSCSLWRGEGDGGRENPPRMEFVSDEHMPSPADLDDLRYAEVGQLEMI